MSIYATLWRLRFPSKGDDFQGCDWIDILAQAVPGHVGTPLPGYGYESGDPYALFLPPTITDDPDDRNRAVVVVAAGTLKGTERSAQEYNDPLLILTGDEYHQIPFWKLHEIICDLLRNESPKSFKAPQAASFVMMDLLNPAPSKKTRKEHGLS